MLNFIINLLYLIFFGSQLITCIFLIIRTIKIKQSNLLPLILFFFFNPLEVILILLVGSSTIVNMLSNICLVIFTKYTFFREKKSPFWYLLISLIMLKIIDVVLKVYIPFSIPLNFVVSAPQVPLFYLYLTLSSLSILLSYPWLGLTAIKYYKSIKTKNVEPWIKTRYQLIGYSSLIMIINGILYFLFPIDSYSWEQLYPFIIGLLITINTTIFSISNLIAWIMPKRLKDYLNRDYKAIVDENLTEGEIMNKIREDTNKE